MSSGSDRRSFLRVTIEKGFSRTNGDSVGALKRRFMAGARRSSFTPCACLRESR